MIIFYFWEILILNHRETVSMIFAMSKTCFKNPDNPSCIDLLLTNRPECFQGTMTMETSISDFHKMVIAVLKIFYIKQKPKIIHYINYKTFNANLFKEALNNELWSIRVDKHAT